MIRDVECAKGVSQSGNERKRLFPIKHGWIVLVVVTYVLSPLSLMILLLPFMRKS